jgi:hypothetical protein
VALQRGLAGPGKERFMTAQTGTATPTVSTARATDFSRLSNEGIVAGLIGAGTLAVWFFVLDSIQARPFYTPTVLGTALFGNMSALDSPERLPVSFETALMFTWVHVLTFAILGGIAAYLLALAERDPNYGFGILLFFVVFMFGFLIVAMAFGEGVLHALAWPKILIGNLLAAGAMAAYFRRRHPNLTIWP